MTRALRIVQRNAVVYRHVWRGSLFASFLQPTLYLMALGFGVGSLIDARRAAAITGDAGYLQFLAPGLLAAACMQVASFEASWPITGKILWRRNYQAILATPLGVDHVIVGELLWIAVRLTTVATAFLVVASVFGSMRIAPATVLAVLIAVLTGLAFSAPIMAYAATLKSGNNFNVLFRFVITPLFMFSGVFFPIDRLAVPAADGLPSVAAVPRRSARARARARSAQSAGCDGSRRVSPCPPRSQAVVAARCTFRTEAVRMNGASGVLLPSWHRSRRMVQRNLLVYKHGWMVIFSGFFEPVFYLLGIGVGLGAIVPTSTASATRHSSRPDCCASSCMNGAITDGCFNICFKLHFQKTYDGILATPMRVPDVAFGEMLWAVTRGSLYAAGFLIVVLVAREQQRPPGCSCRRSAVLAFPAAVLGADVVFGDGAVHHQLHPQDRGFRHGRLGLAGDADVPVQRDLLSGVPASRGRPVDHRVRAALPRHRNAATADHGRCRSQPLVLHVAYLVVLGATSRSRWRCDASNER